MVEYLLPIALIDLGPNRTQTLYDKYTHQYVTTSDPQTILALKNLACAVKALYAQGSYTAQGIVSDADAVECTAWPKKSKCFVTVRCRPIQADNLGKIGFEHCDATATTSGGDNYSISGGPVDNGPYKGKLGGWVTNGDAIPAEAYQGTVVYTSNSCKIADCMVGTGKAYQSDPGTWPNYIPTVGPNSNDWIKGVAGACGASLPINTWGDKL